MLLSVTVLVTSLAAVNCLSIVPGLTCHPCLMNACKFAKCDKYPTAICKTDPSCGCIFSHFELYGKKYSKEDCKINYPPVKKCPAGHNYQLCHQYVKNRCDHNNDCQLGQTCCNDGCKNVCQTKCPLCFRPPCQGAVCKKYPGAKCIPKPCSCSISHYVKLDGSKITEDQCIEPSFKPCSGPKLGRPCSSGMKDECGVYNKCPKGMFCCNDGCVNKCRIETDLVHSCPIQRSCPIPFYNKCSKQHPCIDGYMCCNDGCANVCQKACEKSDCLKNPCSDSKCPRYSQAQCVPNYCGGCNAEWWLNGKLLTDKECNEPLCKPACEDSVCKGYEGQGYGRHYDCVPNTCKDCEPMFYDKQGNSITSKEIPPPCPDAPFLGRGCIYRPCTQCWSYPNAVCRACGGCHAEFYVNGIQIDCRSDPCPYNDMSTIRWAPNIVCSDECSNGEVCCKIGCKKKCRKPLPPHPYTCPPGEPETFCKRNTCKGQTCPNHPEAECRSSKCGRCKAEWFVNNNLVNCAPVSIDQGDVQ